jgi:hypothetical protein
MSDSEDESRDRKLKVVIVGDGSSGKVIKILALILAAENENKFFYFCPIFWFFEIIINHV